MLSSMNRANAVQWIKDFGGKCCNVVKELFYDVSDLLYHQICNIKIVSWKKSLNYKKSNFNGPLTARVLQLENLLAKDAVACCKTRFQNLDGKFMEKIRILSIVSTCYSCLWHFRSSPKSFQYSEESYRLVHLLLLASHHYLHFKHSEQKTERKIIIPF